jgi:hypothetical protein
MPRGHPRCHRRPEPRAAGLGQLLPHGKRRERFNQLDSYVWRRVLSLRIKRKGRHLQPGEVERWTREYFWSLGLLRLRGTVQYPEQTSYREAA